MKAFPSAIALSLAVPAFAQTMPATKPLTDQAQLQHAQCQHADQQLTGGIHQHCRDMMKHHTKTNRRTKTEAEQLEAEFNGNGHQGHKH